MLEAHHSNIKDLGLFSVAKRARLKDIRLPKLHEILPVYNKMKWGTEILKIVFGEQLSVNSPRYMTSGEIVSSSNKNSLYFIQLWTKHAGHATAFM